MCLEFKRRDGWTDCIYLNLKKRKPSMNHHTKDLRKFEDIGDLKGKKKEGIPSGIKRNENCDKRGKIK